MVKPTGAEGRTVAAGGPGMNAPPPASPAGPLQASAPGAADVRGPDAGRADLQAALERVLEEHPDLFDPLLRQLSDLAREATAAGRL